MPSYKYKYLRVMRKSDKMVIKRVDVGHLSKSGREAEWDKLDKDFPPSEYVSCFEQSNSELPVFESNKA
jgi:hypothetical protein